MIQEIYMINKNDFPAYFDVELSVPWPSELQGVFSFFLSQLLSTLRRYHRHLEIWIPKHPTLGPFHLMFFSP